MGRDGHELRKFIILKTARQTNSKIHKNVKSVGFKVPFLKKYLFVTDKPRQAKLVSFFDRITEDKGNAAVIYLDISRTFDMVHITWIHRH